MHVYTPDPNVHERLNANLHERNTTCVDKVSLKKIMSKQMRISLSRTGPRRRSKRSPISFLRSAPPLAAAALCLRCLNGEKWSGML